MQTFLKRFLKRHWKPFFIIDFLVFSFSGMNYLLTRMDNNFSLAEKMEPSFGFNDFLLIISSIICMFLMLYASLNSSSDENVDHK